MNRKTVERKFLFLAEQARLKREKKLRQRAASENRPKSVQFDEMESFERSKCLPLSIPLLVEEKTREILSFRVASMPAKGPLAEISRRKYGPRTDDRKHAAAELWKEAAPALSPKVQISTDQKLDYPGWIQAHLPHATHVAYKGRRGCVVGQGELKKGGRDPLFWLNHTAAMIRAHMSRLVRRTWCTTKRPERLQAHLEIYAEFHNEVLIRKKRSVPPMDFVT